LAFRSSPSNRCPYIQIAHTTSRRPTSVSVSRQSRSSIAGPSHSGIFGPPTAADHPRQPKACQGQWRFSQRRIRDAAEPSPKFFDTLRPVPGCPKEHVLHVVQNFSRPTVLLPRDQLVVIPPPPRLLLQTEDPKLSTRFAGDACQSPGRWCSSPEGTVSEGVQKAPPEGVDPGVKGDLISVQRPNASPDRWASMKFRSRPVANA